MNTTLDLTPAGILQRAADVIDRNGWNQDGYACGDDNTPLGEQKVCALGAIALAAGLDPYAWGDDLMWDKGHLDPAADAADLLAQHLGLSIEDGHTGVIGGWNDDPARTREQVTAALRAAAQEVTA